MGEILEPRKKTCVPPQSGQTQIRQTIRGLWACGKPEAKKKIGQGRAEVLSLVHVCIDNILKIQTQKADG